MSPSIHRSFTGNLELDDQPVPATIRFAGDDVSLLVGGDSVGTWRKHEISFLPEGGSYSLVAEGDRIRFHPDGADAFRAFLDRLDQADEAALATTDGLESDGHEPPAGVPLPTPAEEERPAHPGPGHPVSPPPEAEVSPPPPAGEPTRPPLFADWVDPEPVPEERSDFGFDFEDNSRLGDGRADEEMPTDLSPDFPDPGAEQPEPALTWDSEPDEYFAAGLNGSPTDSGPPSFRPAVPPAAPAPPVAPAEPGPSFTPHYRFPDATQAGPDAGRERAVPDLPAPAPETPPGDDFGPGMADPEPASTWTAAPEMANLPATEPGGSHPEASPPEAEPPGVPPIDADGPGHPRESRGAAALALARNMIAAFKDRPAASTPTDEIGSGEIASEELHPEGVDDTPRPIDERDNLRQWGLVVAGGVVLLVLVGMVTWGLASMLGGNDDPAAVPETTPSSVVVTTAAPAVTTTTTIALAPTTISPENAAAATGFVERWNQLATQYAYHLSISADSLPISVAPAPTVHLTYDESGVLDLRMAPKGTGSDRDLLLAMGLAVAWADPGLDPEGRREVLGAMGVDVDDPQLADMGGTVTRNGVTYEAQVVEGLIEFRVVPGA